MKYTLTLFTTLLFFPLVGLHATEPKRIDLGEGVTLEVVYLPPGEFMMGSSPEERSKRLSDGLDKSKLKCGRK
jgi:formylglycine-generating enzyme required for sulfatase activity